METDLPVLQPLSPLSHGHALVGPPLGLATGVITTLLIFSRKFCPPLSWRASQLRGLLSELTEGLCMLSAFMTMNELSCSY